MPVAARRERRGGGGRERLGGGGGGRRPRRHQAHRRRPGRGASPSDDLEDAGWSIEGPDEESDGFTRVWFRKGFDDPDEAAAIFEEIAGEDGPFQDFAVSHDSSFARTHWGFRGRVDFSGGVKAFSDDELGAVLDGEPLGESVDEIEQQLGEALSRIIQVRVGVRLPGDVTSNATTKAENGARWQVAFGDGTVDMEAQGQETRTATVIGVAVAILCAGVLLVYGLVRLAMRSSDRKRSATPE
jgi:hypothetical protein